MSEDSSSADYAVRDFRGSYWFWADHDIIDKYGPILGVYPISVYMYLARRVDATNQRCWPSYNTIAKALKISRGIAINAVQDLVACGLVRTEERRIDAGHQSTNYFYLMPRDEWKDPTTVQLPSEEVKAKKRAASQSSQRGLGGSQGKQDGLQGEPSSNQGEPPGIQQGTQGAPKQVLLEEGTGEEVAEEEEPEDQFTNNNFHHHQETDDFYETDDTDDEDENFNFQPEATDAAEEKSIPKPPMPAAPAFLRSSLVQPSATIEPEPTSEPFATEPQDSLIAALTTYGVMAAEIPKLLSRPEHCWAWMAVKHSANLRNPAAVLVSRVREGVFPSGYTEEKERQRLAEERDAAHRQQAAEVARQAQETARQAEERSAALEAAYSNLDENDRAAIDLEVEEQIRKVFGTRLLPPETQASARRDVISRFLDAKEAERRRRESMSDEEIEQDVLVQEIAEALPDNAKLVQLAERFDPESVAMVKAELAKQLNVAGLELAEDSKSWAVWYAGTIRAMYKAGTLSLVAAIAGTAAPKIERPKVKGKKDDDFSEE